MNTNRFQSLRHRKNVGLIPFFVLGYPTPEKSLSFIKAALACDIAGLELGFPFSDPVADGPIIQHAMEVALKYELQWQDYCRMIAQIRKETQLPIGLLIYSNLLYQQGLDSACANLAASGIDGVLPVDIPYEEDKLLKDYFEKYQLGRIHLIAPNTPIERAKILFQASTAFAYILSRYGTTGVSQNLPDDLQHRLSDLVQCSGNTPLVVGFGISNKEHVNRLEGIGVHAAIVGSALIKELEKHLKSDKEQLVVSHFLKGLRS